MKVLPMLEDLKQKMTVLSSGIATEPDLRKPHDLTVLLARTTPHYLNEILVHDLWCASCVIHPGLKCFSFMNVTDGNAAKLTL